MYKVTTTQSQYQTYTLSDDSTQSQVTVIPSRGGIITEWSYQNQDIFYLDRERLKDPQLSVRGGIPLLFPICGNLVDNSYEHGGKTYQLPQHGFARNLPWEVTEQSTNQQASITVTLKSNEQTKQGYPFDFRLDFTYILKENTLELIYRHQNLSPESMPFATGIHPYFSVPDKDKLEFAIPSTQYQIKGDANIKTFNGKFDFSQEEIDFAFINLSSNIATVIDRERQLKLTVEYDDNYVTLVFWTQKNQNFYCLEPWSAPRNALNTGDNLIIAKPGETVETKIILRVE